MISIATLNGRLLISTTDGRTLGEVKGIYLDEGAQRGAAVYLGKTGILSRKEQLIDLKHIQLFGVDAWLVARSDVTMNREDFAGAEAFIPAESLYGREIQTDGGTRIGTIEDVIVDARFKVLGFSFARIFVQGPLAAQSMTIARTVVSDLGDKSRPMIASLEQAEKVQITTT